MDVMSLVIEMGSKIKSLQLDLDVAKYTTDKLEKEAIRLKEENEKLIEDNEALKKKIEELEF